MPSTTPTMPAAPSDSYYSNSGDASGRSRLRLRRSVILEKLRAGRPGAVLKINLIDPRVVELAGLAGADAVWLCNEHVPNDWLNLENQVRAARVYDMDTIVRVEKGSYSDLLKPFEAGATGVMVPHVTTADEARELVSQLRFRPLGSRPLDGGGIDGAFCQIPVADYLRLMNEERFAIFQIESPEAVENVEAIAAVPGYEILLFGAGDFSHLIGQAGNLGHPEVTAARKRVGEAARRHGKFGMLAGVPGEIGALREEGYSLFTPGGDVVALGKHFRDTLAKIPLE